MTVSTTQGKARCEIASLRKLAEVVAPLGYRKGPMTRRMRVFCAEWDTPYDPIAASPLPQYVEQVYASLLCQRERLADHDDTYKVPIQVRHKTAAGAPKRISGHARLSMPEARAGQVLGEEKARPPPKDTPRG